MLETAPVPKPSHSAVLHVQAGLVVVEAAADSVESLWPELLELYSRRELGEWSSNRVVFLFKSSISEEQGKKIAGLSGKIVGPRVYLGSRRVKAVAVDLEQKKVWSDARVPFLHSHLRHLKNSLKKLEKSAGKLQLPPKLHFPYVTCAMAAVCLFVLFRGMALYSHSPFTKAQCLALGGTNLAWVLLGDWWRLLSQASVHLSTAHLVVNLLGLLLFGVYCERRLGPARTAWLALVAALAGGMASGVLYHKHFLLSKVLFHHVELGLSGVLWAFQGLSLVTFLGFRNQRSPTDRDKELVFLVLAFLVTLTTLSTVGVSAAFSHAAAIFTPSKAHLELLGFQAMNQVNHAAHGAGLFVGFTFGPLLVLNRIPRWLWWPGYLFPLAGIVLCFLIPLDLTTSIQKLAFRSEFKMYSPVFSEVEKGWWPLETKEKEGPSLSEILREAGWREIALEKHSPHNTFFHFESQDGLTTTMGYEARNLKDGKPAYAELLVMTSTRDVKLQEFYVRENFKQAIRNFPDL